MVARKHPGRSSQVQVPVQGEWARIRREWSAGQLAGPGSWPGTVGSSERADGRARPQEATASREAPASRGPGVPREPSAQREPSAPAPGHEAGRTKRRRAVRTRWWLWAGIASAAAALVFGVLLVLDLTSSTPAPLRLPQVTGAHAVSGAAGAVSGTWSVTSGSQVGYRVHEVLFGFDHVAVGVTDRVTGGMVISGTRVVAADFSVQMASVRSGVAGRDVTWRDFIMNTGRYPRATFHLTRAIAIGHLPPIGEVVRAEAVGDLTLRGVTRSIRFGIAGERLANGAIDLQTAIPIRFAEWHIPNPSFAVAKVGGSGTLEVLLHLARSGVRSAGRA